MKKITLLFISLILMLSSCKEEVNPEYEIVKVIANCNVDSSFMFVIYNEEKNVDESLYDTALSMIDAGNYTYSISKTIIKYDEKKDVLMYYRYLIEDDVVTRNFVSFVYYVDELKGYVITNSNTMTYHISTKDTIEDIFIDMLGSSFDVYVYHNLQSIFENGNKYTDNFIIEYDYEGFKDGYRISSMQNYLLGNVYYFNDKYYEYYDYCNEIEYQNIDNFILDFK